MVPIQESAQTTQIKTSNLRLIKVGLFIIIFMSVVNGAVSWLEMAPPPTREEHQSLMTLLPIGGSQEHHFKRLDRLDNSYFYVAGHGFGDEQDGIKWVLDQRLSQITPLTPQDLAHMIRQVMRTRNVPEDRPIYLLACNAGAGNHSFAQQLSEELQTKVIAPSEWLVVDQLGLSRTGPQKWTAFFNFGEFRTRAFKNGTEII